jgi:LytS/YehU family sensor histidine kinase
MVAPLLFIPFIENAFKHSKVEDLNAGWIKIRLTAYQDRVHLLVQNSMPSQSFAKDKVGGIGLQNVKKQLDLLYPDKHVLQVDEMENQYHASLTINLL